MITLSGYQSFIINVMQIPTYALPPTSPIIAMTLGVSLETVNPDLQLMSNGCNRFGLLNVPSIYELAVYNLAADYLINFAPDQPGQTYFTDLRTSFTINNFVPGVISASADESTSETLEVPNFMKNFTMSDLQRLKTPYGRQYLAWAQDYGTLWGIS